jgi:hypothetical protein
MNKDNKLMLEMLHSKFTQTAGMETHVTNALQNILKQLEQLDTAIHLSKSSHVDQLLSKVRDATEMMMSERGSGTSEDAAEPIMKNTGPGQIESGSEDAEHRSKAQQAAIAIALQKAGKKK